MKRILFVCCLFTATCAVPSLKAHAQTTVTVSDFNSKVNLMDTYIGAGNTAAAQTTWQEIHTMMMTELATTKSNIASASSAGTSTTALMTVMQNQTTIYRDIWTLKNDLTTNRTAIHTRLLDFSATF